MTVPPPPCSSTRSLSPLCPQCRLPGRWVTRVVPTPLPIRPYSVSITLQSEFWDPTQRSCTHYCWFPSGSGTRAPLSPVFPDPLRPVSTRKSYLSEPFRHPNPDRLHSPTRGRARHYAPGLVPWKVPTSRLAWGFGWTRCGHVLPVRYTEDMDTRGEVRDLHTQRRGCGSLRQEMFTVCPQDVTLS